MSMKENRRWELRARPVSSTEFHIGKNSSKYFEKICHLSQIDHAREPIGIFLTYQKNHSGRTRPDCVRPIAPSSSTPVHLYV